MGWMDLKFIRNIILHISIRCSEQDFFTFINRNATFQYAGGPGPFSVLLWSSQSRVLPVRGLAFCPYFSWNILDIRPIDQQKMQLSPLTRMSSFERWQFLLKKYLHVLFEMFNYIINNCNLMIIRLVQLLPRFEPRNVRTNLKKALTQLSWLAIAIMIISLPGLAM